MIPAHSPQGKGRVERSFGTAQDRMVKEMRLAKVKTLVGANALLDGGLLDKHNRLRYDKSFQADLTTADLSDSVKS